MANNTTEQMLDTILTTPAIRNIIPPEEYAKLCSDYPTDNKTVQTADIQRCAKTARENMEDLSYSIFCFYGCPEYKYDEAAQKLIYKIHSLSSRLTELEENPTHRNNLAFYNDYLHIEILLADNDFTIFDNVGRALTALETAIEKAFPAIERAYNILLKRIDIPEA